MSTVRVGGGANLGTLPADVAAALLAAQQALEQAQAAYNSAVAAAEAAGLVSELLSNHAALTTSAHGGIVANTDPRLSDARAPTTHAASHGYSSSDPTTQATTGLYLDILAIDMTGKPATLFVATDHPKFLLWTGTGWLESTAAFIPAVANGIDRGSRQASPRWGYGKEGISRKALSQCTVGGNERSVLGAFKVDKDAGNGRDVFQMFLNGVYETLLSGVRIFKSGTDILSYDYETPISLITGDSQKRAINQLPVVQRGYVCRGSRPYMSIDYPAPPP